MFDVDGFILVGGVSSRMGTDKAQLVLDGRTSIERISQALSTIASSVALVGAHQDYRHLPFRNVPDIYPAWGALGGIHAALAACERDWALIVACDLPFLTADLFQRLADFRSSKTDAVVPIQPDGRPQPLCALYRRDSCLPQTEQLIKTDEHTPRALLAAIATRWVDFEEVKDLPGASDFFLNVNTPADLVEARQRFESKER